MMRAASLMALHPGSLSCGSLLIVKRRDVCSIFDRILSLTILSMKVVHMHGWLRQHFAGILRAAHGCSLLIQCVNFCKIVNEGWKASGCSHKVRQVRNICADVYL